MLRCGRSQDVGLLLDCFDDFWVLVTDVGEHQLTGEIQILLSIEIPEIGAFPARDRQGRNRALSRPRMEYVRLI